MNGLAAIHLQRIDCLPQASKFTLLLPEVIRIISFRVS